MPKTDKELTVEVVCAHLNAWSGQGKTPACSDALPELIKNVYKAIQSLAAEN